MNDYRNNPVPLASARRRDDGVRRAQASAYAGATAALAGVGPRPLTPQRRAPEYDRDSPIRTGRPSPDRFRAEDRRGMQSDSLRERMRMDGRPERRESPRTRFGSARGASRFMRYAADSKFVQAIYSFVTGPTRALFYALVIGAVAIGLYLPIRDFYVAYRTNDILTRQVAVRDSYNSALQDEVDGYLSQEGIEQSARKLGMVLPGETRIEVTGQDDADADRASGAGGGSVMTSGEVSDAEQAVAQETPWYLSVLDTLFFFDGVEGQTTSSAGASAGE